MKRAITILTSLAIIIMTVLPLAHINTPIRLFMGETTLDMAGRLFVLVGLIALSLTWRPRSVAVRAVLGVIGGGVLMIALSEMFEYRLAIFDALIYLVGAASLLIEALEPASLPEQRPRRVHASML